VSDWKIKRKELPCPSHGERDKAVYFLKSAVVTDNKIYQMIIGAKASRPKKAKSRMQTIRKIY